MTRKSTISSAASAAILAASAWILTASPSAAFPPSGVGACVAGCMSTAEACQTPVREAAVACRTDAGCDALLEAAKTACEADHQSADCQSARVAVKECLAPCKDAQQAGLALCRNAALTCLKDDCGLDGLPPRCGRSPRVH